MRLPTDAQVGRAGSKPRLPLLAPWWRMVDEGDRIVFEHAGRTVELRGRAVRALLPALLPLLDGAHTQAEIIGRLGEAAEPSVRKALDVLDEHGLLSDGPHPVSDKVADYIATSSPDVTPSAARAALAASRVVVQGSSAAAAEVLRLLATEDVPVRRLGWEREPVAVDLFVAAPTPTEVEELRAANAQRLADGVPWLVVLPYDGRLTTVGPLYVPGRTACHSCFSLRRGATSGFEDDFALVDSRPIAASTPDALAGIAGGLAALLSMRWLAAKDPTLPGVAYALEANAVPTLTRHRVLRVPRCTVCGPIGPPPNPWYKEGAAADAGQPVHAGR